MVVAVYENLGVPPYEGAKVGFVVSDPVDPHELAYDQHETFDSGRVIEFSDLLSRYHWPVERDKPVRFRRDEETVHGRVHLRHELVPHRVFKGFDCFRITVGFT